MTFPPSKFPFQFRRLGSKSGLSLVELLIVIAVIAVIAAIAIPNISRVVGMVASSRDLKNAQTLAGLAAAARSAGHPGWSTKSNAISSIVGGLSVTNSADPSLIIQFRMDSISPEDQAKASAYLSSDGFSLIYTPAGGQPTN
jgi:type IV pilus assembly protein PilA